MPMSPIVAGPTAPLGADSIGVMQAALFTGASPRGTAELVMMLTHHPELTPFGSLVHQVVDGKMYPGIAFEEAGGAAGHRHGSTAVFARGWSPVHTSTPVDGTVSLGTEVNILPAAIEAVRARGDLVVAQLNPRMPYTYGDAVLASDAVDYAIEADEPSGSAELYEWVDRNPRVRLLRTEKTNDPGVIARQRALISVNTAQQVDLFAQANASRVHGAIYSGFGGQTDFVVGALHSPDGHAIIALPSWHPKANVSTVTPRLTGPVTSFQHSVIVSEQGTASIWGHHANEPAQQITDNVAHPDARPDLRDAGRVLDFSLR